jgi:hypothetical protein
VILPGDLHRHCHSPRTQNGQNPACRLEPAEITYESAHLSAGMTLQQTAGWRLIDVARCRLIA